MFKVIVVKSDNGPRELKVIAQFERLDNARVWAARLHITNAIIDGNNEVRYDPTALFAVDVVSPELRYRQPDKKFHHTRLLAQFDSPQQANEWVIFCEVPWIIRRVVDEKILRQSNEEV